MWLCTSPPQSFSIGSAKCNRESDTRFSTSSFFHESVSPRPPSIPLEPFWICSKSRGDICELMFTTGVVDTGDKLFSGVNDTGKKFIAGVVDTGEQFIFPWCRWYRSEKKPKSLKFFGGVSDTGDYRVLPILACLHLKMKNKQNFNL